MTAHWGIPDPPRVEGTEADRRCLRRRLPDAESRIGVFASLPLGSLDSWRSTRLDDIGRTEVPLAGEGMSSLRLPISCAAEFLGTALLLATVVGSGIMGERLAGGNVAIALLGNTLPTGAMLVVLITMFGPISGAHFNPAVTLVFALARRISRGDARLCRRPDRRRPSSACWPRMPCSTCRCCSFRPGAQRAGQWLRRVVATFGLLATILCAECEPRGGSVVGRPLHHRRLLVHRFDSFANPAVTIARALPTLRRHSPGEVPPSSWRSCSARSAPFGLPMAHR